MSGQRTVREASADDVSRLQDDVAEQLVLDQILTWPQTWPLFRAAGLSTDDFAREHRRIIYRAIAAVDADGLEPDVGAVLTRVRTLDTRGDISAADVVTLHDVATPRPAPANVGAAVAHLRTLAQARAVYYAAQALRAAVVQDPAAAANGLLAQHRERLAAIADSHAGDRCDFRAAADVMTMPAPRTIVDGIAWADSLTVLAAESGAGKTYTLLDTGGAVADGVAWHGRRVYHGSVAYVTWEGDALGPRLRALVEHQGRVLTHLHVLRAHDPISPRIARDGSEERTPGETHVQAQLERLRARLAALGHPPIALVTIDTVRASMTGAEESSEHAAAYIRAVRRLMTCTPGAAWILAHHAGWQDGRDARRRERGSSAWRGNCDATMYLEAGDYDRESGECPLTLSALKVRDSELPPPLRLIRRRVELAEAVSEEIRDGARTSCVVVRDVRTREDVEAAEAEAAAAEQAALDRRVLRAMRDVPTATSIHRLRETLALRCSIVEQSVSRILTAGWAVNGSRGRPYQLTPAGHVMASEEEA